VWLGANGGAIGAKVERRRHEDRGTKVAEGCANGEGEFPSQPGKGSGEGTVPLPKKSFDF